MEHASAALLCPSCGWGGFLCWCCWVLIQRSEVMFRIRKQQNRVITCNFSLILYTAYMNLACLVRSKCVLSNLFAFSISSEVSAQQCEWTVKN
jgi:hypothetical protein